MAPVPSSITYLEFYSGIGGWGCALKEATERINQSIQTGGLESATTLKRLGAFDHSDLCNRVFHYNFPAKETSIVEEQTTAEVHQRQRKAKKRKKSSSATKPVCIESLTKEQLEEKCAFIWMMSPPCQPHSRQHNNQNEDIQDPRSKSFIHLCDMISTMDNRTLPRIIMLENVVGFEKSNSCRAWRQALRLRNYSVAHFHLNPTQCGIPNDRPRHYAMAVLLEAPISNDEKMNEDDDEIFKWFEEVKEQETNNLADSPPINTHLKPVGVREPEYASNLSPLSHYLDVADDKSALYVPAKILNSDSSWCFDILTPLDKRSACFTSSYGKFVRGTGSVLYEAKGNDGTNNENDQALERFRLVKPGDRKFDENWKEGLDLNGNLRYFSGTEIARLFGFPVTPTARKAFRFPPDCTNKQQWKLLGNSINVKVAAKMCEAALRIAHSVQSCRY
jgi:tRNA (cytosine38-C5)-methyltransferase